MCNKQIICLDFVGNELEATQWREIDHLFEKRILCSPGELSSLPEKSEIEALLVKLGAKVDQRLISQFPNLRYIGMLGTGYGGIDTKYAVRRGITVTNIADYATEAVAEFTFGLLLENSRDISRARTQAQSGNYSDDFSGTELKGSQFGVVGLGNIGQRTACLASAFGCEVSYWSKHRKKKPGANNIQYQSLEKVLKTSDIISLNLALNPETQGIITAALIKQIKPGAVIINLSPMELFDFTALVKRLKKNDVTLILDHSDEMTDDQLKSLRKLQNCHIYPPIGYLTRDASQLKKRIYVTNLKNYLQGTPTNVVR